MFLWFITVAGRGHSGAFKDKMCSSAAKMCPINKKKIHPEDKLKAALDQFTLKILIQSAIWEISDVLVSLNMPPEIDPIAN